MLWNFLMQNCNLFWKMCYCLHVYAFSVDTRPVLQAYPQNESVIVDILLCFECCPTSYPASSGMKVKLMSFQREKEKHINKMNPNTTVLTWNLTVTVMLHKKCQIKKEIILLSGWGESAVLCVDSRQNELKKVFSYFFKRRSPQLSIPTS